LNTAVEKIKRKGKFVKNIHFIITFWEDIKMFGNKKKKYYFFSRTYKIKYLKLIQ